MRRALFLAALFLLSMLAVPAQQLSPTGGDSLVQDWTGGFGGWTVVRSAGTPSRDSWHLVDLGDGNLAAYAGYLNPDGSPGGYDNDVEVSVSSPWFDARGSVIDTASFRAKGSSQDSTDVLRLQVRTEVVDWQDVASLSGVDHEDAFTTVDVAAALAPLAKDSRLQLRFLFTSDGTCPSSPPAPIATGDPTAMEPPSANDEGAACAAENVPETQGWHVDDLQVTTRHYQVRALAVLHEEDFVGGSAWTGSSTDTSPDGAGWYLASDGNGDSAAARAGDAGGGYSSDSDLRLTSPVLQTRGFEVRTIRFDVKGASETDYDYLYVDVKLGAKDWQPYTSLTGSIDSYRTVEIRDREEFALLSGAPFDRTLQVRFRFVSDDACDSHTEADPTEDPTVLVAPCDGGFAGWTVDNVRIDAWRLPASQVEDPIEFLPFHVPAEAGDITGVDIQEHVGEFIGFEVDETALGAADPWDAVRLTLTHQDGESFQRAMVRVVDGDRIYWFDGLAADDPALLLGEYTLTFDALTGSTATMLAQRTLDVLGADDGPPRLTLLGTEPFLLGPNEALYLQVEDQLLRDVTYRATGPEVRLPSPYVLPASALREGLQSVEFRARDRAGLEGTLAVDVVVDTTSPSVRLEIPEDLYTGVPFDVNVTVTDATASTVRLRLNDTDHVARLDGSGSVLFSDLELEEAGQYPFEVQVKDAAGNQNLARMQLEAKVVATNLTVVSVQGPGSVLAGSPVELGAVVRQSSGVADVPVAVRFSSGAGPDATFETDVLLDEDAELSWSVDFMPGMHTVNVTVEPRIPSNETGPGDEWMELEFEVFLGNVVYGEAEYFIRASPLTGLPLEAVNATTGEPYPLVIEQIEGGQVFAFNATGTQLHWNPLERTTAIPAPQLDDQKAPGLGPLGFLAMIGAAMFLRRR